MLSRATLLLTLLLLAACASGRRSPDAAYKLREVDTPPKLLGCAQYAYSEGNESYRRRHSIGVLLRVDAHGSVEAVHVNPTDLPEPRSENDLRVRQAALTCRFEPATRDGVPVAVRGVRLSVPYSRENVASRREPPE